MKRPRKKSDTLADWTAILRLLTLRDIKPVQIGKIAGIPPALARKYLADGIIPNFNTASRIKSYLDGTPLLTWASVLKCLRAALESGKISKSELARAGGFSRQAINHWLKPEGPIPTWTNGIFIHLFLTHID